MKKDIMHRIIKNQMHEVSLRNGEWRAKSIKSEILKISKMDRIERLRY